MPATINYLILKVTLNLKKSLNCKINKYNSNTSEHDEAEEACILGYWRMPKINITVDQFAIANISALSMLEALKKVVKVQSHVTNTRPVYPHQNQTQNHGLELAFGKPDNENTQLSIQAISRFDADLC